MSVTTLEYLCFYNHQIYNKLGYLNSYKICIYMETLIIKPKEKAEFNFFLELAKKLGTEASTIEDDADERLFQSMEKNKKTTKVYRQKVFDTLNQIINE